MLKENKTRKKKIWLSACLSICKVITDITSSSSEPLESPWDHHRHLGLGYTHQDHRVTKSTLSPLT